MARRLPSPFIAGFEASTMRRRDGRRNDLIAATRHDELAEADYRRMLEMGLTCAREGTAWHRIEAAPGRFDPSSAINRVRTAERLGIQVIWDLCHFGWPDDVDIFGRDFPDRLARYAGWFARLLRDETSSAPWYVPVNEPSFVAWAAGDVEYLNPFQRGRGDELKRQLVRASLAAAAAVRAVDPRARICHVDPVIHIEPRPGSPDSEAACRRHNEAQYAAWDMLGGRLADDLGGSEAELDIVGVNFYDRNQWIDGGSTLRRGDPGYRPLREMLLEVHERYRRPIVIAETGTEGPAGPGWLRYVCDEVLAARALGAEIDAVCIYPVLDYPGWDDDRHVSVGLWGYADESGDRVPNDALIAEFRRQAKRLGAAGVGDGPRLELQPPGGSSHGWPEGVSRTAPRGSQAPARILLVTDSRAPSGMGRQMLTLARGLARDARVVVAAPDAADDRWLLEDAGNAGIEVWPLVDGSPEAQAASMRDRLTRTPVDVANVHAGIGWEGHRLVATARERGVACVVRTEHLPYLLTKGRDQASYLAALPAVEGLIAVSDGVARSHVQAGVPAERIRTVLNGVEDPEPSARQAGRAPALAVRAAAGIPAGAPLLVSLGRLTYQKGYDVLIQAMAAVRRCRPDAHMLIAGSGPLAGQIHAAIDRMELGPTVHHLQNVDDVPALLGDALALVLASRFEGLPLVALEAMAMRRPVIGTRVCGIDEAVADGLTGRLVAPDDPAGLADAIVEFLSDPGAAARLGLAGRRRYEAAFTARRMVRDTLAAYAAFQDGSIHATVRADRTGLAEPRRAAALISERSRSA